MRLLHTSDHFLRDFIDDSRPPYTILSHTWGEGEVLLKDIESGEHLSKKQWPKVLGACKKAASDGFQWIWIDTLCIDKTSSAELSEAINSMYRWYSEADVCFAYLTDFPGQTEPSKKALESCRWFYRGWTLQELISPRHLEFYDVNWDELGTRLSLAAHIREITGVCLDVLWGSESVGKYTVACRFSWMAGRKTTRGEDKAYAMMGLFGINMPLLYGEGPTKAFKRLQEEILRQTDDQTILLWANHDGVERTDFLAPSLDDFCRPATCKSNRPHGAVDSRNKPHNFNYEQMRVHGGQSLSNPNERLQSLQLLRSQSPGMAQPQVQSKAGYTSIPVWLQQLALPMPPKVETQLPLQLTDGREVAGDLAMGYRSSPPDHSRDLRKPRDSHTDSKSDDLVGGVHDISTALLDVYVASSGYGSHSRYFGLDLCHYKGTPGNVFPLRMARIRQLNHEEREAILESATYQSILIRVHEMNTYADKPPPSHSMLEIESPAVVEDTFLNFPSWNCAEGIAIFRLAGCPSESTAAYLVVAFEVQLPSFRPTLRASILPGHKTSPVGARTYYHSYENFQARTSSAHPSDRVRVAYNGRCIVVSLRRRPGPQGSASMMFLKLIVRDDGDSGAVIVTSVRD